jgi:branched-chain amino acid transport system substrate-binding protein
MIGSSFPVLHGVLRLLSARASALLLVAVVGLTACASSSSSTSTDQSSKGPIRIAFIGAFSGPFAVSSITVENGLAFGTDEINGKGGISGRKIELIKKDDQGQANTDPQLVQEQLDAGVKIFISQTAAGVRAIVPLMKTNNFILYTNNPPAFENDPAQVPYGFNITPSNQDSTDAIAKFASKKGEKKWAVVADSSAQVQEYVRTLGISAQQYGGTVIFSKNFDSGTTDFSSVVKQVKDVNPDAIMFFAFGAPVARFLQAVKAAGVTQNIYGSFAGGAASDLSTAPVDVVQQQYYFPFSSPSLLDDQNKAPLMKEYGDMQLKFYSRFGKKPGVGGGSGYDQFLAIVWALKQAGGDDPTKMRAAMETTAGMGGIGFTSPQVKYSWSKTNHGGFPPGQVRLAKALLNADWPGLFPIAPGA